jgi:hypothetical protein
LFDAIAVAKKGGVLSSVLARVGKHLGDLPFVAKLAGLGAGCFGVTDGTFDFIPLFVKAPYGEGVEDEQCAIYRYHSPIEMFSRATHYGVLLSVLWLAACSVRRGGLSLQRALA